MALNFDKLLGGLTLLTMIFGKSRFIREKIEPLQEGIASFYFCIAPFKDHLESNVARNMGVNLSAEDARNLLDAIQAVESAVKAIT